MSTERIAAALERIAAALETQNGLLAQQAVLLDAEPQPCLHPEDKRIDESTMGHPRWRCTECGFRDGYEEGLT
jgi:transposase-like protein